jgi:DNA-binding NarL/FixJ family response regulator
MSPPVSAAKSVSELLRRSAQVRKELAQNLERMQQTLQSRANLTMPSFRSSPSRDPIAGLPQVTIGLLDALTPREVEVMRLIAQGLSTKDIAGTLQIRFKTAVCHRSRILQKLGVHETVSLVRLAIRAGLIEP